MQSVNRTPDQTQAPVPDLSIVIVSWNVRDLLAACLDSIHIAAISSAGLTVEVIVVDSASHDGTLDMLNMRYPWVQRLPQTENVGFTVGNNIGLIAARGRYLMLLNPDTEVIGDALAQMVAYLDEHPAVGMVGPHTLNTDGSTQSSKRRFPTVQTAVFESTWLQKFAPRGLLDRYYTVDIPADATAEVDWMQGSALMIRRAAYTQVGGLDTHFVMFSEEVDWCKRVKAAGWHIVYVGSTRIIHHGGKSTDQVTARKHIHFQQSKLYYFRKHHGALIANGLRLFLLISYFQQAIMESLKVAIGYKRFMRHERRQRVGVYWQVIRALVSG